MSGIIRLLFLFMVVTFVDGSLFQFRYKKYISKIRNNNQAGIPIASLHVAQEEFVSQPLDHFDPLVKGSINQKYYVINEYWKKPNGPVFLYIGGEGSLSESSLYGLIAEVAEEHGALIIGAEHRYYGESLNDDSLQLTNLQYLSSQQALSDLAKLHQVISEEYGLGPNNTWICFGGSYAGDLAAWFRIKYPHLVRAAVASSAPVRAVTNFESYNDVVRSGLADTSVGGSSDCVNNITSAFKEVERCLHNKSLDILHEDFNLCSPLQSKNDYATFLSNLAESIEGAVQYNDKQTQNSIGYICSTILAAEGSPYNKLMHLNRVFLKSEGEECLDSSYLEMVKTINKTKVQRGPGVGLRQWIYQTCTQFGFYQTCDVKTQCPFSTYLDLNLYLDMCNDVFGITSDQINAQVNFTNQYYGSDTPKGTRILFVNGTGSIDPWHSLSVLKDLSDSEKALYIQGTSHCADMAGTSPSDTPELQQAKQKIKQQISNWLTDR